MSEFLKLISDIFRIKNQKINFILPPTKIEKHRVKRKTML